MKKIKAFLWRWIFMDLLDACPRCGKWRSRKQIGRIDYCTVLIECKYCHYRYLADEPGY